MDYNIKPFFDVLTSFLSSLILLILGLETVRNVIAWIGLFPRDHKYSWVVYRSYNDIVIKEVLRYLGISENELNKIRDTNKVIVNNHQNSDDSLKGSCKKLVSLLSRYTYNTDIELTYGKMTPVKTRYYINTMEASKKPNDLEMMSHIMWSLVKSSISNDHGVIDFIITPKIGNPVFGYEFAKIYNMTFMLRKSDIDKSRANFFPRVDSAGSARDNLRVNYEGFQYLLEKLNDIPNYSKPLYGIVMDCNASGASEIYSTMLEFNALIEKANLKIEKLKYAYILFRPDVSSDVDARFSEAGFVLKRYFDLNEHTKCKLNELGRSGKNEISEENVRDFIAYLYEKCFLKTENGIL